MISLAVGLFSLFTFACGFIAGKYWEKGVVFFKRLFGKDSE